MNNMILFNAQEAEKALIEYISSGVYSERTMCKKQKDEAQAALRQQVVKFNQKRTEFEIDGHSVVAKFIRKEVTEVDHAGMISDILDYIRSEGLSQIISIDSKTFTEDTADISIVDDYLYIPTYYQKFTPNKFGKSFALNCEEDIFGFSAEELIRRILFYKDAYKMLDGYHDKVLAHFKHMDEMQFKTPIGTVSKVKKNPVWDVCRIAQDFGDDFLIEHGKVKLTQLERLFDIGALPPEILWDNRRVIDHNVEFHVMTLEAEQKMLDMLKQKEAVRNERYLKRVAPDMAAAGL